MRGARQHNLKNINIDIPKNKLVVFTGVSGSGKSSLAFDTIYAEGQRRYVESLSTYARQFLGIMEKPDVDLIEGLSPAISIDQKTTSRNPRSTVGTTTEIYDYLRLLFARVGHPHCPVCGREIANQSTDEILDSIIELISSRLKGSKTLRFLLLSPLVVDKKGEYSSLFDNLKAKGYTKVRVDKIIKDISEDFVLLKTNKHTIEAVIDKFSLIPDNIKDKIFKDNLKSRLRDSLSNALKLSDGLTTLAIIKDAALEMPEYPKEFEDHLFSEKFACPQDNISLPEIEPRTFSFNSPHGACNQCSGIGKILKVEPNLLFSYDISITEGAILPFSNIFENDTWYARLILKMCTDQGIDPRTPFSNLPQEQVNILLNGTGEKIYKVDGKNRFGRFTSIHEKFEGIINELERRRAESNSDWVKNEIERYMKEDNCPKCKGARLNPEALSITIDKKSIPQVSAFNIEKSFNWIEYLLGEKSPMSIKEKNISNLILKEIRTRLKFLLSVGLNYLTIDRSAGTLAGGEAQRIRLASQIGSGLSGVLYVLDEPTIGLHQKDNRKLINTLKSLRDLGNTVLVVEHDEETIRSADYVVDFGPGAGNKGGFVIASGTPCQIENNTKSLTGKYLSSNKKIDISEIKDENPVLNNNLFFQPTDPDNQNNHKLTLYGCSQYNLKNIDVSFPLGKLVVITGVSGSGKSTLLVDTLYNSLLQKINPMFKGNVGLHKNIEGWENVNKVILIDQSPIGRTPRSNPATYTKIFDMVRDIFAQTKDAKVNGFDKGRFSFNVKGGRCDACEGQGQTKIEMQFMSDIWINCDVCNGTRYNSQTLDIEYKGKNISQVLSMTVDEALEYFHSHKPLIDKLETIKAVGLGYIELGQPATTLSGGEAQRVKLASELAKRSTGNTIYILDEPTTGLHFYDVEKLLKVLKLLVMKGNSVFIIEHNMDVIRNADWIIDLGPEGGDAGGDIIAQGTVENIKKVKKSFTGQYLEIFDNKYRK